MKCTNCGLVNFKTATNCKRCGTSLVDTAGPAADDATVAWRDSDLLVLALGGVAPLRCMQCNSSDGVTEKVVSLGYYPTYNLVLLIFGFVYYKKVSLGLTLCETHMSARSQSVTWTVVLIIVAVLIFIVALVNTSALIFGLGVLVLLAGMVLGVVRGSPVSISRMDKSYVWIKGVNGDYLSALPKWTSR